MSIQNIVAKTEEYLRVPAVVRQEHPFMTLLADDFNSSGYEVEKQDRLLAVKKKGTKSSKIVTAHIDRHGIVVNGDGNFEYAAFNAKKHYRDENQYSGETFKKCGQTFIDETVYAYDSEGRFLQAGIVTGFSIVRGFSYDLNKKDLFFEIEGLKGLPTGVVIAYHSPLVQEAGNISSQIDNVISVAVAYQLVQDGFDGTLLLTTEEEIGKSWQYIADYLLSQARSSQEIITLDTTPYDDARAISQGLIVLRNEDTYGAFNQNLVLKLRSACEKQGKIYEMKDEVIKAQNAQLERDAEPKGLGKTELGAIVQHTDGQLNGATVQLPTINYHTNYETTSELALENYYEVLKTIL